MKEHRYRKTSKDLLLRTRGKTWQVDEAVWIGEFARVEVFGRHRKYYIRVADLGGKRDRITLYEKNKSCRKKGG